MEKYLQKLIVLLASLSLIGWAGCINSNSTLPTDVPYITDTVEPTITSVKTNTIEPTLNDSILSFKLLTEEMINELTDITKSITGKEDVDKFHNISRNLQGWEIECYDGKKVTIEVVEKTDASTTTKINTSDLSGTDSKFTIVSSKEAVFLMDITTYSDIRKLLFFAPSIDEFVVCPYYSVQDWYCNDSIFAPDGPVYVNILISTTGIVVVNPTYMQIENVKHKYDLEYGSDNPSLNPNFQDYLWENKDMWCGKEGDEKISYKLPTLNNTYILEYNNCPEWSIEPIMELTEDNIDDFGFSIR